MGYSKECLVKNYNGIHARPSSLIARKAEALSVKPQTVYIERMDNKDQADSLYIMEIMGLAAAQGAKLLVFTKDNDLRGVVDEIASFIENMESFD